MSKHRQLALAILILPINAVLVIPGLLLHFTRSFDWLGGLPFPDGMLPLLTGVLFILLGLFFSLWCVRLFFTVGDGTPAPWAPPRNFVVEGPYRHVRNPMLMSVLAVILGEAILAGSWALYAWFAAFWLLNTVYFMAVEEPGLKKRFGDDYVRYTRSVGRWIPKWKGYSKV